MKYPSFTFALTVAAALALTVSSCSKDDDPDDETLNNKNYSMDYIDGISFEAINDGDTWILKA